MPCLAGHDLPARWGHRDDFVMLEAGFGHGQRFLATWAAWLADQNRCRRLVYIAVASEFPSGAMLLNAQVSAAQQPLMQRLASAWPVMTPGLHTLTLDEGPASHVTLLLGLGDVAELLPQLVARVDAFHLDGLAPRPGAPDREQGWLSRLARLAAPGATAVTQADAEHVLSGLRQSGFAVAVLPEEGLASARFEPHHTPAPLAGGLWPSRTQPEQQHALIIGAGLAGCATAWALARQGWRCTVVDAHASVAQGASGNPGGLFHSIIHGEDGIHARAHRAAAMRTAAVAGPWLWAGRVKGACQGLIRLDTQTTADKAQALIQRLALPDEHVRWLDTQEASSLAGIPVPCGGWLFHQGGWLSPSGYAQTLLDEACAHAEVRFMGGLQVHRLERTAPGVQVRQWQALDQQGRLIAQAPVVVLASAHHTSTLMNALDVAAALPLASVRGQISRTPLNAGAHAPDLPVAGAGYALPAHEGLLLFGATSDANDPDPAIRESDHWRNLEQAAQLGCLAMPSELPAGITGRVGWRATTPDRLPYVGPLPLAVMPEPLPGKRAPRGDQPRFVPRLRDEAGGVYVLTGLGSRGITWAALAGELLASWVTGSPSPVEACLRDALDPARIVTRARARENQADASD